MNSGHPAQTLLKDIGFTLLSEGKTIKVRANGYSMYPSVKPGSIIFIEPLAEGDKPASGEIIAWKRNAGFVVHRLVRSFENGDRTFLVTRGDSTSSEDEPVDSEQVAGRVIRIENPEGRIVKPSAYLKMKPDYRLNRLRVLMITLTGKFLQKLKGILPAG
jgi:signal peptidase I